MNEQAKPQQCDSISQKLFIDENTQRVHKTEPSLFQLYVYAFFELSVTQLQRKKRNAALTWEQQVHQQHGNNSD